MIRQIYLTLLFLVSVQIVQAQVWSPWTTSSMGDTTMVAVDTITGSGGGDSIVSTFYNFTVGQIIDQHSAIPTLSLGFCQGSMVRVPGNIDTLGLDYSDDLKLRLFFTKNVFLEYDWQSENPDIYFALHQYGNDGEFEEQVYERRFKQLEGIAAMKCVGTQENGIPYYRTFSDSINVILGPDQQRNLRLFAFAVGHADTIINQELNDLRTLPYHHALDLNVSEKTLHSTTLSWVDSSAYAESYDVYRDNIFIGNVNSGTRGLLTFKDRYDFDSETSFTPGTSYDYRIIAQNTGFPEFSDSLMFADDLTLATLDIGLTSALPGNTFMLTWDNSQMLDQYYDLLTIMRNDEIILESRVLLDEFIDSLPVFGQRQEYNLRLSNKGDYLVEFLHTSDILPPNGQAQGTVLTQDRKLPVNTVTVTATTILEGDTSSVNARTDKFGNFNIPGIFYGRESIVALTVESDTSRWEIFLTEDFPVSERNILFVSEGSIDTENAPVVNSMISNPVDSINVVEISYECDETENVLFQLFRNDELISITEDTEYTDLSGYPGVNYRYAVRPFKHLGNKAYLLGNTAHSDVEFPKITVPGITLTADADKGIVSISVHHHAENLDGILIYRDSLLWNDVENPWTGEDWMAEPGKEYEYSAQAYRIAEDTFATSGINRALVQYPEIPFCENLSASSEDGFLELAWDFSGNEAIYNFDGFRIYRDSILIGFVLKGKHSYYDYHGIPGGDHLYSISSYLQVEDMIFESDKVNQEFMVPGLSAPHSISASKYEGNDFNDQVLVTWASDFQDTYDGYLIIRDGGENGSESFELPSPYQETYIDMVNLSDLNYKMGFFENLIRKGNAEVDYKLLAYADHGDVRYFSDTARTSYTFILEDTTDVFAPVNFMASDNTSGNITLDWDYPEFMTSTFLLYRDSEFIGELPVGTRRYQDIRIEPGSRYIYHLRAVFDGDSSVFVADAGSISSGYLVHGKVMDQNYQPVVDVKLDLTINYTGQTDYKNNVLSNASGYFVFPELSLLDFTEIYIMAEGVNSQFLANPVTITAGEWDGSHIYVEFTDATEYKLHQQENVATPVECFGKADNGSGTLFLTWGASNANFSYFEISRGLRKIGTVEKGQPLILIDSTTAPGHAQAYNVQAFWQKADGSLSESPLIPFIAEAPILPAAENLEVIPFADKNRVEVSWSHPTNNVNGYYIYRNREILDSCTQVPFIFIDTTGVPNYLYTYGVTAYWRNNDNTEFESEVAEKECEFPEVYDPTNLSLKQNNNSIELSWVCDALNFEGFLVYRDSKVIDTVPYYQFNYRDFGGYSGKYQSFGVAAFRKIGNKLICSRVREKAYVFPELVRIENITTDSTDRQITIGWNYGSEGDSLAKAVDGFKVFREGYTGPIETVLADNRTEYSITDNTVDPETDYTYSIIAYKEHLQGYMESKPASVDISTEKLHVPVNFIVEPNTVDGYYRLTWNYYDRLDIDGFFIEDLTSSDNVSLSGRDRIFIDTRGEAGNYRLQAFKHGKYSDPIDFYSNTAITRGAAYSIDASKGKSSTVKLLLSGLTGSQTYNIRRDGELIDTREIPAGASEYVVYDSDVDPGRKYTYSLYDASAIKSVSIGWAKPDGVIGGAVRTPETAGVPLVTIIYTGKYYDTDTTYTYYSDTTVTDGTGAYAFSQVRYGESTEYQIKALREGHAFSEDTKTVFVTQTQFQVNCDFTDISAISLVGTVKHEDFSIGWEGVNVVLTTIKDGGSLEYDTLPTDKTGFYGFTIEPDNPDITSYVVSVISEVDTLDQVYSFINNRAVFDSDTLRKFGTVTRVDFVDTLTSDLHIKVVNGGGVVIPKPFRLKLNNRDYQYEKSTASDFSGEMDIRVPASTYSIELTGVKDNEMDNELYGTYFQGKPENINLSPNKYLKADTCVFVYHTPARIEILYSSMKLPPCIGDYVVQQDEYYLIDFGVTEIHGGEEVPVNSGKILIRNGASLEYLDTVEFIQGGRFNSHYFVGGEPELIQPHRKYLHAAFIDDFGQKLGALSFPVIVTGKKSLGGTDIFINPENYGDHSTAHIPMYVLRDPPGDGSWSYLERGITVNRNLELSREESYYSGFKAEGQLSFFGVGGYWDIEGRDENSMEESSVYKMSVTSTERLETASDALEGQGGKPLVGRQADVVVGMDMLFTYTIQYDISIQNCEIVRKIKRTYKPADIKSTWIYTRNQIEAKVKEFSESEDILVRDRSAGSSTGTGIQSLQVLAENWQGVIDYIDHSGDPEAWIDNYTHKLRSKKETLEYLYLEAITASGAGGYYIDQYYTDLADQLNQIITGIDGLLAYLDAGPPIPSEEGSFFSSAAALDWYTAAIQRINAFEKMDVIEVSGLSDKRLSAMKNIYETLVKEGDEIYGDVLSYPAPKNYTFGGGTSFESSSENLISRSTGYTQKFTSEFYGGGGVYTNINFRQEGGWWPSYIEWSLFNIEMKIGGYGGNDESTSATNSEGSDTTLISGFTLSDNDPGDQFSVNVLPSLNPTQTAYFALVGGRSSCPEEEGTIYRDAPTLSVENPLGEEIVSNVLEGLEGIEEAVFPLKIGSLNSFRENRSYTLSVDPASNRFNATILANGKPLGEQTYSVSPYEPTFVDLSIIRRPGIFEADSIEVSLSSTCEGNIEEKVYLSAFWERPCTPVTITEPVDQWVSNRYNDKLLVKVTDFDPDCEVLNKLRLECRKGGQNNWEEIAEVSADSLRSFVHATSLIYTKPTFIFTWYVNDPAVVWDDGGYQLRVIADCNSFGGGQVYSNIVSGTIDRKNIRLAGPPEPLSGILTMGGKVMARFTEEVSDFEYRVLTDQGELASGLEMIVDGQEIVLLGADNTWRNLHHGESFTVELSNVEDYWGNSTSNTSDSLITWDFRVWNAPIYVLRNSYEVSVPLNGKQRVIGDLMNNLISCESAYFGQTANYTLLSSAPASLSVSGPQSIQLPGQDSLLVYVYGNRNIGVYNDSIVIDNLTVEGNTYADIVIHVRVTVVPELTPWEIDESQFESTMNLVANFEINGELSSNPLDMISVFINNEIRGLAHVEAAGNNYWAAYLTAGQRSGEDLTGLPLEFRIWDASEGKEYDGHPEKNISFASNTSMGTSLDPVILHVDPVDDLISYHPLHRGWNYLAFTPASLRGDVNKVLGSLSPNRESVIKTLSGFATYTADHGWLSAGDELMIDPLQGYMLYLTHDDNLRYPGGIYLQDTVVDIMKGWNLVAYPFGIRDKLSDVLEISDTSSADLIKGETPDGQLRFSDYSNLSWSGSLVTLYPMYSYMLYSEGSSSPKLIWQSSDGKKADPSYELMSSEVSDYNLNLNAYEKNMTVIGIVELDGVESISNRDSVVVMNGDTVVGFCSLKYRPEFNRYFASFMIYGNSSDLLDVYIYNYDRNRRYNMIDRIMFVENKAMGSWDIPYTFSASSSTGTGSTYPGILGFRAWIDNNQSTCKIEFVSNEAAEHRFEIYDLLGRKMIAVDYYATAGKNYLEIPMTDEKFASGVYILKSTPDAARAIKLLLQ